MALSKTLSNLFKSASAASGIGAGYYERLSYIESGHDPNAKNPNSRAGGLFQFLDSTWKSVGSGTKYGTGDNVAKGIADLTGSNFSFLKKALGRAPSNGELYLAHQQGADGAAKLLSNPNALAADLVGYDAVTLNGGTAGMTAKEFAGLWIKKFGGGDSAATEANWYDGLFGGYSDAEKEQQEFEAGGGNVLSGVMDWASDWMVRGAVIFLGFIFVAVGLYMFAPGAVVNIVKK